MKYAIPGRAIFDKLFVFVVIPVIQDIKNWIPEIYRTLSIHSILIVS